MKNFMKELRIHTLIGDIQQCGVDGMNKKGIQEQLAQQYVNPDSDITMNEFGNILDREYAKVEAWRASRKAN